VALIESGKTKRAGVKGRDESEGVEGVGVFVNDIFSIFNDIKGSLDGWTPWT
jgi:hypothetical protein